MFVPEKVMAGYYDLSDSVDNSQKNSLVHVRKSLDGEAKANQMGRTQSAAGAGSSALGANRSVTNIEQMRAAAMAANFKDRNSEPVVVAASLKAYVPNQISKQLAVKPQFQGQAQHGYGRGGHSYRNADAGGTADCLSRAKSPPRAQARRMGRKRGLRSEHPALRRKYAALQ